MGSNQYRNFSGEAQQLRRYLMALIVGRAIVLPLGLNLADRLGVLQERFASFSFPAFFNVLTLSLTLVFLALWFIDRRRLLQLYAQTAADLGLTTILVAYTGGIESAFVSFYVLIVIYCSLTLGRNGGMVGAALSTILYAGIIITNHMDFAGAPITGKAASLETFRVTAHAIGFWAVAYLGTYLHQRLRIVEVELKEKIDSLTELRRLNEHIVSSIRSGLITTGLDGSIAVFNTAAQELTGRDAAGMIGKSVGVLFGEAFWDRILKANLLKNAKALRHEEWIEMPGGSKRYLGFSVSPLLDESSSLIGFIISFQDLTDINRLEEEVRLKDRMAAVGRMAAGIAHEIRNPLTSMRGSVEILRSRANIAGKDARLLDILIEESDRLNQFIEDFLSFANPRRHPKQVLDLVPVLRDSVALMRNNPEIRDTHTVDLRIEEPSFPVFGSGDRLKQVFWNLAQNAIRAMPEGGRLTVGVRNAAPGTGEIFFQDEGIGMSPEQLEKIFQPFHSNFRGGHGLGLSIVFQIMEDHKAKIVFESGQGKGTRVRLIFPLEDCVQEAGFLEQAAVQG